MNKSVNNEDHGTKKRGLSKSVRAPVVVIKKKSQSLKSVSFATSTAIYIQGATAKGMNATYAKRIPVHVPLDFDKTEIKDILDLNRKSLKETKEYEGRNLAECYEKIATQLVIMEERNIFCGPYNILILQDM